MRPALAANRNVVIVAAIVLVVIVVVAGIALASSGGGKDDKTAPKLRSAPPLVPATSASPSATPSASPSSGALPAGFTMHKDASGYSVPVPAGWSGPERKQGGDYFYSPDREVYLQIDQTDDPGDSAIDDWRKSARNVARFPGYKKIRIAPTGDHPPVPDTGDGDDSADWEFTYNGDGGRVHILNRGFVTNGHGYAILLCAPDADWSKVYADLQPVYEHFAADGRRVMVSRLLLRPVPARIRGRTRRDGHGVARPRRDPRPRGRGQGGRAARRAERR